MNCFIWMAALSASLASSPPLESTSGYGLNVGRPLQAPPSPGLQQNVNRSLDSLLGKNWGVLHSWGGWSVTPWLRLRVAPTGSAHAGGALEASFIPFHTFIRPTLTLERGSSLAVATSSVLRNAKSTDRSGLRSFNYYYDGAFLGAEMGTRWFDISLNLGISRAQASVQGIRSVFEGSFFAEAAQIGPAARLGVLVRL